jgi:hypothetical protein
MSAHGRSEALIPKRTARRLPECAHGRSEALNPQRVARRIPERAHGRFEEHIAPLAPRRASQ